MRSRIILAAVIVAAFAGSVAGQRLLERAPARRAEAGPGAGGASQIVSLAPSITEVLFAVGAGDDVVGVTSYCFYPPAAREVQRKRVTGTPLNSNADMGPTEVREICKLDETGRGVVRAAMQQLQMSARAFHRLLKLARTIADLADSEDIETVHLAEAIQYRPRRAA